MLGLYQCACSVGAFPAMRKIDHQNVHSEPPNAGTFEGKNAVFMRVCGVLFSWYLLISNCTLQDMAARSGRIPFLYTRDFFEMPPLFFLPPRAEIGKNPLIANGKLRSRTRNGSNAPRSTYACSGGLPCCRGCPLAVLYCE